jgi:hypothetical protein
VRAGVFLLELYIVLRRTKHLTAPNPELESRINRTAPGQASWAEPTSSATCGQCAYWRDGTSHAKRCAKYTALMNGKLGPRVPAAAKACKYFAEAGRA